MAERIVDGENGKTGCLDFQPEEGIFVAVVFAARIVETEAIEHGSMKKRVEHRKLRGRVKASLSEGALLLGLYLIAPTQFATGRGFGEVGDAADKHIGGFPLLPIRENEIVGADFCIGVHEQYIRKAG